jgi:hypothetical protein
MSQMYRFCLQAINLKTHLPLYRNIQAYLGYHATSKLPSYTQGPIHSISYWKVCCLIPIEMLF